MVIDSNILIGYLNGESTLIVKLNHWLSTGRLLMISTVSAAEVCAWDRLTVHQIREARDFLSQFFSIAVDDTIAYRAAEIRRAYRLSLTDAIIAATALIQRAPLVTRDEDFTKVSELELILP